MNTAGAVQPSSLALHVTYTCPLTCKHCCFKSSPSNKDRLDYDLLAETIEALDASRYRLVAFTGGEPMLLGNKLVDLVSLASHRGFKTRVVSSVHFAVRDNIAHARLSALKNAGLDELSISWDDYHEEFVSFENVRRAVRIGLGLGIGVAISATEDQTSRWNSARIRSQLGPLADGLLTVCDSPLNKTGRAETDLQEKPRLATSHLGPCPYVLTGPTLSAKGKLLACCGVVPEVPSLVIDPDFAPSHLDGAMQKAQQSVLLNWLYVHGPFHLMKTIAAENGLTEPDSLEVAGNCEACQKVLTDPTYTRFLPATLSAHVDSITGCLQTLDALGVLQDGRPIDFMPA